MSLKIFTKLPSIRYYCELIAVNLVSDIEDMRVKYIHSDAVLILQ